MKRLAVVIIILGLLVPAFADAKKAAPKSALPTYSAVVAVPTDVYGKTRFYALIGEKITAVRLTRTPPAPLQAGTKITFTGQEKSDETSSWFSAPIASLVVVTTGTAPVFSSADTWPATPQPLDLIGRVLEVAKGRITLQVGSATGTIIVPSSAKITSKIGDTVMARGWSDPDGPKLYLLSLEAVSLVRPVTASASSTPGLARPSGALSGGLVSAVGAIGLLAYLRNEKLKKQPLRMAVDKRR